MHIKVGRVPVTTVGSIPGSGEETSHFRVPSGKIYVAPDFRLKTGRTKPFSKVIGPFFPRAPVSGTARGPPHSSRGNAAAGRRTAPETGRRRARQASSTGRPPPGPAPPRTSVVARRAVQRPRRRPFTPPPGRAGEGGRMRPGKYFGRPRRAGPSEPED